MNTKSAAFHPGPGPRQAALPSLEVQLPGPLVSHPPTPQQAVLVPRGGWRVRLPLFSIQVPLVTLAPKPACVKRASLAHAALSPFPSRTPSDQTQPPKSCSGVSDSPKTALPFLGVCVGAGRNGSPREGGLWGKEESGAGGGYARWKICHEHGRGRWSVF